MKKLIFILPILFLAIACEKDISVDLPTPTSKVVVDGYVENGLPPYLILSRNSGYFEPVDSGSLNNNSEKGAIVIVDDGFVRDTMAEIDTIINGNKISGIYIATKMFGIAGRNYSLTISTKSGELLSASTKLQGAIPLDSLWFKVQENKDSLGFIWANLNDPDTIGNCYRWFAKRITKDPFFIAPFGSVFEDKFINGKKFDFAYNRGSIQNSTASDDINVESGFFKKGDTVIVKFCTIDHSTFEFWRDAENQLGNNGSPFAVPSNVKSNIKGGLGVWASYNSTLDTLFIPK